jgi:hypothetical protein
MCDYRTCHFGSGFGIMCNGLILSPQTGFRVFFVVQVGTYHFVRICVLGSLWIIEFGIVVDWTGTVNIGKAVLTLGCLQFGNLIGQLESSHDNVVIGKGINNACHIGRASATIVNAPTITALIDQFAMSSSEAC